MNNIQNSTTNSTPALQRWEEKSPSYKRDLIIKTLAIAVLAVLAVAILAGGMAAIIVTADVIPAALFGGLLALTILGPPISAGASLTSLFYLHPFTLRSYQKEKGAKKVCEEIRTTWAKMPRPAYTIVKNGERWTIVEQSGFKRNAKAWVRYGFMTSDNCNKLLQIIEKDKSLRSELTGINSLIACNQSTESELNNYRQQITQIDRDCQSLKSEWEAIIQRDVIPDLPF